MIFQNAINEKMRELLIDSLVDIHRSLKLVPEALYLTVNLIDRYLSQVTIIREEVRLVVVAALFIATKYEKSYVLRLKDTVDISSKVYTEKKIFEMEGKILVSLGFNLLTTSSYTFLQRYARINRFNEESFNIARYLLELALMKYHTLQYTPSNLACSAIYLVNKLQEKDDEWPDFMAKNTKYTEAELRPAAKYLCTLLRNAGRNGLYAVMRKFASEKFFKVSRIHWENIHFILKELSLIHN